MFLPAPNAATRAECLYLGRGQTWTANLRPRATLRVLSGAVTVRRTSGWLDGAMIDFTMVLAAGAKTEAERGAWIVVTAEAASVLLLQSQRSIVELMSRWIAERMRRLSTSRRVAPAACH